MTTQTNTFAEYRDDNQITETDAQGRYARVERDAEAGGMPTYVVLLGTEYAGTILDEADANGESLPRGRYAANSSKTGAAGFFATIDEAADAIAETWPAPAGPKGTTEPRNQAGQWSVRGANPMRRYNIIAEAARLHDGTRTVAKAWKDALEADWRRRLAEVEFPPEAELENCMSYLGGEVHTAQWANPEGMPTMPICRTGAQNHMRTRYMTTKGELTCSNCIAQRERREAHRAAR